MAYLLGMYYGNGKYQEDGVNTTFFIEIPYKTLVVDNKDISIYVKASVNEIKNILQGPLNTTIYDREDGKKTILFFTKSNDDYFTTEFKRLIGHTTACEYIRIVDEIFSFTKDDKYQFLRGFADSTGYIRDSNKAFVKTNTPGHNRVYIEIPHNWMLVVDIANLLLSVGIPVQTIDWAHPNMRDGNLKKCNEEKPNFWKKEHQIKVWAHEFAPIGFTIKHKEQKLQEAVKENLLVFSPKQRKTQHEFYWEKTERTKKRENHPSEGDVFIPEQIRGKHFNSWQEIAKSLGYPPKEEDLCKRKIYMNQ